MYIFIFPLVWDVIDYRLSVGVVLCMIGGIDLAHIMWDNNIPLIGGIDLVHIMWDDNSLLLYVCIHSYMSLYMCCYGCR